MEFKRDFYLDKLIKKHNGLIKAVTGIRRCGRSYWLNKTHFSIIIFLKMKWTRVIVSVLLLI